MMNSSEDFKDYLQVRYTESNKRKNRISNYDENSLLLVSEKQGTVIELDKIKFQLDPDMKYHQVTDGLDIDKNKMFIDNETYNMIKFNSGTIFVLKKFHDRIQILLKEKF